MMTGYDLATRIGSDFPEIMVLLTTGYASDVATGKMRSSDQFEVLHKPYHQRDLARRLSALLGRS
jgi:CheY-like chemotaxis protein